MDPKLLEIFLDMIKNSNFQLLFYTVLILLSVWLFKEFRKSKMESDNLDIQRINDGLQAYGKVIASIRKYELKMIDKLVLLDELVLLYTYATEDISKLINKLILEDSVNNYKEIYEILGKELDRLKSLQCDSIAFKFNDKYLDSI